jgi:hypothetical protein
MHIIFYFLEAETPLDRKVKDFQIVAIFYFTCLGFFVNNHTIVAIFVWLFLTWNCNIDCDKFNLSQLQLVGVVKPTKVNFLANFKKKIM